MSVAPAQTRLGLRVVGPATRRDKTRHHHGAHREPRTGSERSSASRRGRHNRGLFHFRHGLACPGRDDGTQAPVLGVTFAGPTSVGPACFATLSHQMAWYADIIGLLREAPRFSARSVMNLGFPAGPSTLARHADFRNDHQIRVTIGGKPHHAGENDPLPTLTPAARQPTALRANRKMWKTTA